LIIGKWIDDVFVCSSENGNVTLEVPVGWITPKLPWHRGPSGGPSPLTLWKRKHHKELENFKKLTGDEITLKNWRAEQQQKIDETKKLKMDLLFVLLSVWPDK